MAASRFALYVLAVTLCVAVAAAAPQCKNPSPPPARGFQLDNFFGSWYEIARIQTAGGNMIQQFCVCTELIYTPANKTGGNASDASVNNSCRFKSAAGHWLNATSYLTMGGQSGGHWTESYVKGGGGVQASYNAIISGTDARGVDYYVEYDCSSGPFGDHEYCLHFLSRRPDGFDPDLLHQLVDNVTVGMGLNPEHRPLNMTMQNNGCWD